MSKKKDIKIIRKDFDFVEGMVVLGIGKNTTSYIGEYSLYIDKQRDSDGEENLWFCLVGKAKDGKNYQFDFDSMSKKRFKKLIKLMKKVLKEEYKK